MSESIIYIVLIGSIVSLIGTMTGAFLGVIIRKPSNKLLGMIIGFAGGLMLSVVVFDLIPEALEKWSFIGTISFCVLGVIVVSMVDNRMTINSMDKHMKVAFMTALGLMIHNFPEGIIMGCGFAAGGALGIKMSIIIAIHDIPEGIAVAAPLIASKVKVAKILFYTLVTALPTAVGTFIGAYIAGISVNVLGACLAFASGIMLYVVCGEMIPESSKLWDGVTSTMGVLGGIIVGLVMIRIL